MTTTNRASGVPAPFIALAAAAVAAPFAAALWLAATTARDLQREEQSLIAAAALGRVETLFAAAANQVDRVAHATGGECTPDTVALMGQILFDVNDIAEIGLFAGGVMRCTSFGVEDPPLELDPARTALPDGEGILILPPDGGNPAIVVNGRAGPAAGVQLQIEPARIAGIFQARPLPRGLALALVAGTGRILAQSGGASPQDIAAALSGAPLGGALSTTARSDSFPLFVVAVDTAPLGLAGIITGNAAVLALGLAAGVALALITLRFARRRVSLSVRMAMAIKAGEFAVRYLPIVNIQKNRCVGAEALLRWNQPGEGEIQPARFIGLAEDSGLIVPLTEWLMRRTVADLGDLYAANRDLGLCINISVVHFKDTAIVDAATAVYKGSKIEPRQLLFEATESALVEDDHHKPREVTSRLKSLGAETGIDDFATGQSNEQTLKTFELNTLKIDRAYVEAIGTKAVKAELVDAAITIAKRLDLRIIAEGVQNASQVAYLKSKGVECAQGFHYSKPLTAAEFAAFVKKMNTPATPEG